MTRWPIKVAVGRKVLKAMRDLKVRVPRADIFIQSLAAMGANPTPIPFSAL